jgi:hypothetical protein
VYLLLLSYFIVPGATRRVTPSELLKSKVLKIEIEKLQKGKMKYFYELRIYFDFIINRR